MTVKYLRDVCQITATKRTDAPRNYSRTGYGSKLPTSRMIQCDGHTRWYRVYVMCYSNCGTAYIIKNREKLVVSDCDLPD